jgi:polyhydroxybutyrate depolymerase
MLLALAAVAGCRVAHHESDAPARPLEPGDHEIALEHGGRARRALVHVPPGHPGERLPVMLAFHGGGGEAAGFKAYAGLDAVADREGFIVVYPFGTGPLPRRLLTFNAGGCCGYARDERVDDVGFAVALLDELAHRAAVDPRRVYATGHSNGAMMAYRLANDRADRIAAIVPVAGALQVEQFTPSRAVAVLHIHSVDDPRALYDGGLGPPFPMTDQRIRHRSVGEAIERWRRRNGCPAQPRIEETRDGSNGTPDEGQTATKLVYSPCTSGAELAHWKLTGVGHGWPGDVAPRAREALTGPSTTLVNAAEEAWRFASRHSLAR